MNLFDPILRSRPFWAAFFQCCVNSYECPSLRNPERRGLRSYECFTLMFDFPKDYRLCWTFDGGENLLELRYVIWEPQIVPKYMRLAWLDCHQMSDFFRWEEYQAITAYLADHDPDRPAWMPALLFSPYVTVTQDCADGFLTMLRRNLEASQMFTEEETAFICDYARREWVRPTFQWIYDAQLGWIGEDKYVWSTRARRPPEWEEASKFDFALVKDFFHALMPADKQPASA